MIAELCRGCDSEECVLCNIGDLVGNQEQIILKEDVQGIGNLPLVAKIKEEGLANLPLS